MKKIEANKEEFIHPYESFQHKQELMNKNKFIEHDDFHKK